MAVSRFYFFEGWLYEKGEISLEEFVEWFYIKPIPEHEMYWNAVEMKFISTSVAMILVVDKLLLSTSLSSQERRRSALVTL